MGVFNERPFKSGGDHWRRGGLMTSPNPVAGAPSRMVQLEDVVASLDSLKFILDIRPVTDGFQLSTWTVYFLQRM